MRQRSNDLRLKLEELGRSDKRMKARQEFIDNYQYVAEIIKQKKNE